MESRRVTSVEVDEHGHVKRLINDRGEWTPQSCADAIYDIENGVCSYYVSWAGDQLPVQTAHDGNHVRLVARTIPAAVDLLQQLPRVESVAGAHHASARYPHLGD